MFHQRFGILYCHIQGLYIIELCAVVRPGLLNNWFTQIYYLEIMNMEIKYSKTLVMH